MVANAAVEDAVVPHRCFVAENAVSGIQAATAGGMAALGIARAGDAGILAGAMPILSSRCWTMSTLGVWRMDP